MPPIGGGAYECDAAEKDVQPVKIGVDICTFRREPFVMGNIARMRSDILENCRQPAAQPPGSVCFR